MDLVTGTEPASVALVGQLLESNSAWFGLPESNAEYLDAAATMQTYVVRSGGEPIGAALVTRHFQHVAEIHFMAVLLQHHGSGAGRTLVSAIEQDAIREGLRLLEVKTLGPSHPDVGYARTRKFYQAMGFLDLEETDLWGPGNPCLIMVKPLPISPPVG